MKLHRLVVKGKIKDGKLVLDNHRYMQGMIARYDDTEHVRVIIEKERGTRTRKQNRYYWGVVVQMLAEHIGYHPEELHEVLKSKFLRKRRRWRGAEITVLQSTTELTSDEFAEYIDRCIQEAAEMGVVIPPADPNYDLIETTSTEL